MKKSINKIDLDYYIEEVNGLKIYFFPNKEKKKYLIRYLVNYGSVCESFIKDNKKIIIPYGTAHFLEHKVFESNDIDPFNFYSKNVAEVNAYTSFTKTVYTVDGDSYFNENLNYLIDFINTPNFTIENVEKEKKIIIEEIKMYQKEPNDKLIKEVNKAIYNKYLKKEDIGGTVESVNSITKEILDDCYNEFYVPNNCVLIIVGNFDKDEAIKVIKNNKVLNHKKNKDIEIVNQDEDYNIVTKEKEITIDKLGINKMSLSFKFKKGNLKGSKLFKYISSVSLLLKLLFGNSSDFKNEMLEKELITGLYYNHTSFDDYMVINLICKTDYPKVVKEKIFDLLKNYEITEKDLMRIKKSTFAVVLKNLDSIDYLASFMVDLVNFYGEILDDAYDIFKSINIKDIEEVRKIIDLDNYSLIIAKKSSNL